MQEFFTDILGVRVSILNNTDTLELIKKRLKRGDKFYFVVTPNPEFLVKASWDLEFKDILNRADLAIPDGIGLVWASKNVIKERVSGTDLMIELCKVASEKGLPIGLIGGGEKIAVKTGECLKKLFPKLKVKIFEVGEVTNDGRLTRDSLGVKDFKGVDILFVALGMGKQEKWIAKSTDTLRKAGVKLAMGVGGAFDYISGAVPRAPEWMRKAGFEWIYRLIRQPWRIKRQIALLEFVYLIFKERRGKIGR